MLIINNVILTNNLLATGITSFTALSNVGAEKNITGTEEGIICTEEGITGTEAGIANTGAGIFFVPAE